MGRQQQGWYIGATLGYGSVHGESTLNVGDALFPVGFSRSATFNGGLFGVEAGANYQFNWVVVGIEGDWQGSTISGTSVSHSPIHPAVFTDAHRDLDSISTVTGRLGIAWDRWLLYGKGGGAWARVDEGGGSSQSFTAGGVLLASHISPARTLSGYVVGGGLEWAPWDALSVKIEGDWYNFGNNSSLPATCVGGLLCTVGTQTPGGEATSKDTA